MRKILAILPSIPYYGKERSNVEVYNFIRKSTNDIVEVVVSNRASVQLLDALFNFKKYSIYTADRSKGLFGILKYLCGYIISNIQLCFIMFRVRPEILFMCEETNFYDLFPALLTFRKTILYRMGDDPVFMRNRFKKYNTFVWKKFVIKRVSKVVCISQYIKSKLKESGRDVTFDVVIYNYPPTRGKSEDKCVYQVKKGLTFGYLGQIIPPKGVHHFVESALSILEKHPDISFYIAGSINRRPDYYKELISMIPSERKMSITFLDEINDLEVFFNHVDVLCVPSIKQEALGNIIVEAKKHRTPCIIYPSGGMPELITHKTDGFICKDQTSVALTEGMLYYIDNAHLILSHSESSYLSIEKLQIGRKYYEKKWTDALNSI